MQDGTWRVKFNIQGSWSVAQAGSTIIINGVNFAITGNIRQALAANTGGGVPVNMYAYADYVANPTTNTIFGNWVSNISTLTLSGDVELASKPTWAY
jgi:hypothetical protein